MSDGPWVVRMTTTDQLMDTVTPVQVVANTVAAATSGVQATLEPVFETLEPVLETLDPALDPRPVRQDGWH